MRYSLIALLVLALAACDSVTVKPDMPDEVIVTVEKYKPLPEWATKRMPKPDRKGSTVASHLSHENALDAFADYLLCHRDLLAKLDKGEEVNPNACEPKP